MSDIGSETLISAPFYQLALTTPGINPFDAISRKQIRHTWNFLMNAWRRPHRLQRLYRRALNLGGRSALTIWDIFAKRHLLADACYFWAWALANGTPSSVSSSRAAASVFAEVTTVMLIPWTFFTSSGLISGKIVCS